jgi:hypothetical protein
VCAALYHVATTYFHVQQTEQHQWGTQSSVMLHRAVWYTVTHICRNLLPVFMVPLPWRWRQQLVSHLPNHKPFYLRRLSTVRIAQVIRTKEVREIAKSMPGKYVLQRPNRSITSHIAAVGMAWLLQGSPRCYTSCKNIYSVCSTFIAPVTDDVFETYRKHLVVCVQHFRSSQNASQPPHQQLAKHSGHYHM